MNIFSIRKALQILFYIQNSHMAVSKNKDSIMYFLKFSLVFSLPFFDITFFVIFIFL